jgi:hypothetical protein
MIEGLMEILATMGDTISKDPKGASEMFAKMGSGSGGAGGSGDQNPFEKLTAGDVPMAQSTAIAPSGAMSNLNTNLYANTNPYGDSSAVTGAIGGQGMSSVSAGDGLLELLAKAQQLGL